MKIKMLKNVCITSQYFLTIKFKNELQIIVIYLVPIIAYPSLLQDSIG